MGRLLEFIVGREPVASATGIAGVVIAALGVLSAAGADLDPELVAAVGTLAAALAGWLARKAVTPVYTAISPPPPPGDPYDTVEGDSRLRGSIPLALIILIGMAVVLMAGLAVCSDALFEDEDEVNDLGLPALVVDHECYDCDDGWGGGSDGNSGGRYEGGRSGDMEQGDGRNCRNFCDNVIYIPDPRGGDEERRR